MRNERSSKSGVQMRALGVTVPSDGHVVDAAGDSAAGLGFVRSEINAAVGVVERDPAGGLEEVEGDEADGVGAREVP